MTAIRKFARFWYDFVVGDDLLLAAGAIATIVATYVGSHHGLNAWWFLPIGTAGFLAMSVTFAARRARR